MSQRSLVKSALYAIETSLPLETIKIYVHGNVEWNIIAETLENTLDYDVTKR